MKSSLLLFHSKRRQNKIIEFVCGVCGVSGVKSLNDVTVWFITDMNVLLSEITFLDEVKLKVSTKTELILCENWEFLYHVFWWNINKQSPTAIVCNIFYKMYISLYTMLNNHVPKLFDRNSKMHILCIFSPVCVHETEPSNHKHITSSHRNELHFVFRIFTLTESIHSSL